MRSLNLKKWVLPPVILFSLVLDQITKVLAITHLRDIPPIPFLGSFGLLIYAENRGAWGGMGTTWPEEWRLIILLVVPALALVGALIYLFTCQTLSSGEALGLALIVSGGMGNLIDRFRFGYVVDMLWLGIRGSFFQTNIFNVADIAIMLGFGFLVAVPLLRWVKGQANPAKIESSKK